MLRIRELEASDIPTWRRLWAGYNDFYEATVAEAITLSTIQRLLDSTSNVIGRVAERDGVVMGFANAVLHDSTWETAPICYLEDLFVDANARGAGVGRALIEDLIALARARGWSRVYWHTRAGNATARRLYDRFVAADDCVRYVVAVS